jgi:hypothetical protein
MSFEAGAGGFRVALTTEMPQGLDERRIGVDRLSGDEEGERAFVLVHRADGAPTLLVVSHHKPTFGCGVHLVPETGVLLLGCGESVCAYDMATGNKLHHDITPYAFHSWGRHGDVVVMSAELEVAAYALDGTRLWAATVAPPWDYGVAGERMHTIVMGHRVEFSLREGPRGEPLVAR